MDEHVKIDLDKFEWAVFIYNSMESDKEYYEALSKLRDDKKHGKIIIEFLNKWKTRVPNAFENKIDNWYKETGKELLNYLKFKSIDNVDIENIKVEKTIKKLYTSLSNLQVDIKNKNGTKQRNFCKVATGKALHILIPGLFVSWDTPILSGYGIKDNEGAVGYIRFLKKMKCLAIEIRSFRNDEEEFLNKHISENNNVKYLNEINGKTLAKFLDEYNWIIYTNRVNLPPKWYPNKKF